jgi:ribosome maturation factor RimP
MRRYSDLEALIQPVVEDMGYNLVGLEYSPSKGTALLRIYIDGTQGVGVDDCKKVSYQINQVLSIQDGLKNNYTLEVSSPGLNRKLYSIDQCAAQIGKIIKLSLAYPIEAQRNFKGLLREVAGEQLVLQLDSGREMMFSFADVDRAQVVSEWVKVK